MPKQRLVVFGATGNQGLSVIQYLLANPTLSSQYTIRAITRNPNSPAAQALTSQGIEVVPADLDDPSTLPAALKDAPFIFATTSTAYQGSTRELETRQMTSLCDEALRQGARYLIWSTLPPAAKLSNGFAKVEHFDVKADIEQYIRSLPIKSAFISPGSFMQNITTVLAPRKSPAADGTYVLVNMNHPTETLLPLCDATSVGAWTNAILLAPERYEGAVFAAAQGFYNMQDMARIMSKVSGKTVTTQRVSEEEWRDSFPEPMGEIMLETGRYIVGYGYYGGRMREEVEWARERAMGEVSDFEGFLRRTGFKLE